MTAIAAAIPAASSISEMPSVDTFFILRSASFALASRCRALGEQIEAFVADFNAA